MSNVEYKELYKKYRPANWSDIIGQDDVIGSLKNAVETNNIPTAYGFFGSHGCGKALHKDTLIPTPNGFITMGELNIGDKVLGSDSRPVTVMDKYCPRDPISYMVRFDDDSQVKTSAGHLWELSNYGDIKLRVNNILTTEQMYKDMQDSTGLYTIKERTVRYENIYNDYLEIFKQYGFNDHYSAIRHIDIFMAELSDSINFEKATDSYEFTVASHIEELDVIMNLMRTLGGMVYIENTLEGVEIVWYRIPDHVQENLVKVDRKSKPIIIDRSAKPNPGHTITHIDLVNDNPDDYFCISVDADNELFLCTESYIPTHNTSTARVLAKSLNCTNLIDGDEPCNICDSCMSIEDGSSLDVVYRSMANAGSVDDVRSLCNQAKLQPMGKKAIYILDEVHNLSKAAFDALLIPLEDYAMPSLFILCSTAPEKIPNTVLSRIQTRNFSPIKSGEMKNFIVGVIDSESAEIQESIISEVVRRGRGSARDTLTLLEKVINGDGLDNTIKNEIDYSRAIIKELCGNKSDISCLVKTWELLDRAEQDCDLENVLIQIFKNARTYIIRLEKTDKDEIIFRKNAFVFLQDVMVICGDNIDRIRKNNGLDVRVFLDHAIATIVQKHPLR